MTQPRHPNAFHQNQWDDVPRVAERTPSPYGRMEWLLGRLIEMAESEQQEGLVLVLTPTVTSVSEIKIDTNVPCFSLTIINDGPNTVELRLPYNASTAFGALLNGEQITFTTRTARLRDLAARIQTAGHSAALRVFALI